MKRLDARNKPWFVVLFLWTVATKTCAYSPNMIRPLVTRHAKLFRSRRRVFHQEPFSLFGVRRGLVQTTSVRHLAASAVPEAAVKESTAAPPLQQIDTVALKDSTSIASVKETKEKETVLSADWDEEEYLAAEGIRSRPVPGGNWNVRDPLGWAKDFGGRSAEDEERLQSLIRLQPGDEGYFDLKDFPTPPGVTQVRTVEDARTVLAKLSEYNPDDKFRIHACDTEVMDIDLKSVGPVGNGYVTCLSIYSGPDFDYGLGDGPGTTLWIDNLDDACGVLQEFKGWFEDERFLKVWHNYGFDRHIMWNEGILVKGFGGDTMHMARLENTSRGRMGSGGGYSLEALTEELTGRRKRPMKEIFGIKRLRKDGSEGSLVDIPPIEVMQRDPKFRPQWIQYSCFDAQGTYQIHEELKKRLIKLPWMMGKNLYEYYFMHMRPFGEVLTDMERRGIRVDARDYLAKVEETAREDRARHSKIFREWAATMIGWPDGLAVNVASSLQLGTLLFGGAVNQKTKQATEKVRAFKIPREEIEEDALEAFEKQADEASKGEDSEFDYLNEMKAVQLTCKNVYENILLLAVGKKMSLI